MTLPPDRYDSFLPLCSAPLAMNRSRRTNDEVQCAASTRLRYWNTSCNLQMQCSMCLQKLHCTGPLESVCQNKLGSSWSTLYARRPNECQVRHPKSFAPFARVSAGLMFPTPSLMLLAMLLPLPQEANRRWDDGNNGSQQTKEGRQRSEQ